MNGRLEVFRSPEALLQAAAERIVACLREAILTEGKASFALSGGTTPRGVYELLGAEQYRSRLDWRKIHLFWSDERCVGPSMPESNFRMANKSLIRNVPIPSRNIHRIRGELEPREAAYESEADIRRFFGLNEGGFPRFSLVLLGLGEDGHTASLFPETEVLNEEHRIVSEVYVKTLAAFRVTLTIPAINNAAAAIFLVSGKTKAGILREVLEERNPRYPAQFVKLDNGQLFWLVDNEAASFTEKASTT
jgi:6-phosphogluconolactonase